METAHLKVKHFENLILDVICTDFYFEDAVNVRMFTCKKLRYIWNTTTQEFQKVKSLGPGLPTSSLHHPEAQQGHAGLSVLEQEKRCYSIYTCNSAKL